MQVSGVLICLSADCPPLDLPYRTPSYPPPLPGVIAAFEDAKVLGKPLDTDTICLSALECEDELDKEDSAYPPKRNICCPGIYCLVRPRASGNSRSRYNLGRRPHGEEHALYYLSAVKPMACICLSVAASICRVFNQHQCDQRRQTSSGDRRSVLCRCQLIATRRPMVATRPLVSVPSMRLQRQPSRCAVPRGERRSVALVASFGARRPAPST